MNTDLATAMRRALESTRAMNPAEATATIQAALAGRSDQGGGMRSVGSSAPRPPRARFNLIDPTADDAETIAEGVHGPAGGEVRAPEPCPPLDPRPPFSVVDPKAKPGAAGRMQPRGAGARMRRSLREVVEGLSVGRPGGLALDLPRSRRPSPAPAVPDGARYDTRSYSSPAGARNYRLYVPSKLPKGPQGLLIMLHGCTQDPDDFASGTAMNVHAEAHGLIVAYPAQTGSHNAASCWNWFRPGDQRRDGGEPAIIAGITQALTAEFGVDPSRVYAAGLSAGGAMAAVMGAAYPDIYAAIGVHSGLAYGSASDVISAFSAMRGEAGASPPLPPLDAGSRSVRTIVFHGSADGTVHPSNADRIIAAAQDAGSGDVIREAGASPDGRRYRRTLATGPDGSSLAELWLIEDLGHAWSGGSPAGSYTDPAGPDASGEMIRFFLNLS